LLIELDLCFSVFPLLLHLFEGALHLRLMQRGFRFLGFCFVRPGFINRGLDEIKHAVPRHQSCHKFLLKLAQLRVNGIALAKRMASARQFLYCSKSGHKNSNSPLTRLGHMHHRPSKDVYARRSQPC
jgi:hypothetical protein